MRFQIILNDTQSERKYFQSLYALIMRCVIQTAGRREKDEKGRELTAIWIPEAEQDQPFSVWFERREPRTARP